MHILGAEVQDEIRMGSRSIHPDAIVIYFSEHLHPDDASAVHDDVCALRYFRERFSIQVTSTLIEWDPRKWNLYSLCSII